MKNKSIYCAVVAFSLVMSLLIGSFLAIAVVSNSTADDVALYGYKLGSSYTAVLCMIAVCIVMFLAVTFIYKKNFKKAFNNSGAAATYSKIFIALALVAYCVYCLMYQLDSPESSYSLLNKSFGMWNTVVFVCALISAVYFFLAVFLDKKIKALEKKQNLFGILSVVPVLGLAVRLVLDYLIQNVNVHGDMYRFHLLAICAMILFAINESRFIVDKAAPALYVFFGLTASMFIMTYAIPTLVLAFKGYSTFDENAVFCLVDVAVAVYIYIRLFTVNWRAKHEGADNVGSFVAFDEGENEDNIAIS